MEPKSAKADLGGAPRNDSVWIERANASTEDQLFANVSTRQSVAGGSLSGVRLPV
jgi:hypothetical protein